MNKNLLLVDDEPDVLMGLRRRLCREKYNIFTAQSGSEGLAILENTSIDAVISDHEMPGMSGREFLRHVHKSYPDTVRFMLTGKATLDIGIQAMNEGDISHFFTKPCNILDIVGSIRQELHQKDSFDFESSQNMGKVVAFPEDDKWEYGVIEAAALSESSEIYITDVVGYIHESNLLGITEDNVLIHIKTGTALIDSLNKDIRAVKQLGSKLIKILGVNSKHLNTTDSSDIAANMKFIEILQKLEKRYFRNTPKD